MLKPYFKPVDGPAAIRATVKRRVRFEECDMLGIMWHGRYPSYFEDAREALGNKHGFSYERFKEAGVVLPIVTLHVDYRMPLEYNQVYDLHGIIHWSSPAKLNIEYEITTPAGELATRGYSIQLMLDFNKNLLFDPPAFYADFLRRWENGEVA